MTDNKLAIGISQLVKWSCYTLRSTCFNIGDRLVTACLGESLLEAASHTDCWSPTFFVTYAIIEEIH